MTQKVYSELNAEDKKRFPAVSMAPMWPERMNVQFEDTFVHHSSFETAPRDGKRDEAEEEERKHVEKYLYFAFGLFIACNLCATYIDGD